MMGASEETEGNRGNGEFSALFSLSSSFDEAGIEAQVAVADQR